MVESLENEWGDFTQVSAKNARPLRILINSLQKDPFRLSANEDLRILLSEMLNQVSDLDAEEVAEVLKPTSAYATSLMDVRA